ATTHPTSSHLGGSGVAASTASGQIAYQGCRTGAQRTVTARASPAPVIADPHRQVRSHSTTSSTASTTKPSARVTGTALTCPPAIRASPLIASPTAVGGDVHVIVSPLRS